MRMHRRQRKKVQVAEILLKKQEMENQKKKRYLEDFYNYLEEKLSANTDHFKDKLAKMEATLIAKYEAEQSNLKEGLVSVEEQLRRMEEEKATLESKKEELMSVCDRRKDEECDNDKREAR